MKRSPLLVAALAAPVFVFLAGGYCTGEEVKVPTPGITPQTSATSPGQKSGSGNPSAPISQGDSGALTGRALFKGTVPPARRIQVSKDGNECHNAAGEAQDVVVSADNALSGAVVEIHGIKPQGEWKWEHPENGYVIRQRDCRFHPDLLIVPANAELMVYNDDPVLHNINTGQWNIAQPKNSKPLKKILRFQGRSLIRVNCDIHSWMETWIYVAQSPYYATTGADGRFRIERVPPGSYKVTASHPALGTQKFDITVGDGQTVEQDVLFRSR